MSEKKNTKAKGKSKGKAKSVGVRGEKLPPLSVSTHPRAVAGVRAAKGWGGLAGFALAAFISHRAGVPFAALALRALLGGLAGYLAGWALGVAMWRGIVVAEVRAKVEVLREQRAAEQEAIDRRRTAR